MTTHDERERRFSIDPSHPAGRIEEEHRTLRSQLDAVAAATTQSALLSSLLGLPKVLSEHFALEEQPDGLYEDLRTRSPSVVPRLDVLCDEHRRIVGKIDLLCANMKKRIEADEAFDAIPSSIAHDVARLLEELRRHEQEESTLIGDVYYTDEGGRG